MKTIFLDLDGTLGNNILGNIFFAKHDLMFCHDCHSAVEAIKNGDVDTILFHANSANGELRDFVRVIKNAERKPGSIAIMTNPSVETYIQLHIDGVDECFTAPVDAELLSLAVDALGRAH